MQSLRDFLYTKPDFQSIGVRFPIPWRHELVSPSINFEGFRIVSDEARSRLASPFQYASIAGNIAYLPTPNTLLEVSMSPILRLNDKAGSIGLKGKICSPRLMLNYAGHCLFLPTRICMAHACLPSFLCCHFFQLKFLVEHYLDYDRWPKFGGIELILFPKKFVHVAFLYRCKLSHLLQGVGRFSLKITPETQKPFLPGDFAYPLPQFPLCPKLPPEATSPEPTHEQVEIMTWKNLSGEIPKIPSIVKKMQADFFHGEYFYPGKGDKPAYSLENEGNEADGLLLATLKAFLLELKTHIPENMTDIFEPPSSMESMQTMLTAIDEAGETLYGNSWGTLSQLYLTKTPLALIKLVEAHCLFDNYLRGIYRTLRCFRINECDVLNAIEAMDLREINPFYPVDVCWKEPVRHLIQYRAAAIFLSEVERFKPVMRGMFESLKSGNPCELVTSDEGVQASGVRWLFFAYLEKLRTNNKEDETILQELKEAWSNIFPANWLLISKGLSCFFSKLEIPEEFVPNFLIGVIDTFINQKLKTTETAEKRFKERLKQHRKSILARQLSATATSMAKPLAAFDRPEASPWKAILQQRSTVPATNIEEIITKQIIPPYTKIENIMEKIAREPEKQMDLMHRLKEKGKLFSGAAAEEKNLFINFHIALAKANESADTLLKKVNPENLAFPSTLCEFLKKFEDEPQFKERLDQVGQTWETLKAEAEEMFDASCEPTLLFIERVAKLISKSAILNGQIVGWLAPIFSPDNLNSANRSVAGLIEALPRGCSPNEFIDKSIALYQDATGLCDQSQTLEVTLGQIIMVLSDRKDKAAVELFKSYWQHFLKEAHELNSLKKLVLAGFFLPKDRFTVNNKEHEQFCADFADILQKLADCFPS